MAAKKGSCLKKLGIGCASIVGLFILLGAMLAASVALNKAEPPEYKEFSAGESFAVDPENNLNLPGQETPKKPIRLVMESSLARFRVEPGQQSGRIDIDSKYDAANFELETEVKEKKNYTEYRIKFKNKNSLLSMAMNSDNVDSDDNQVTVKLPADLLFHIDADFDKGDYEVDLTGLAVEELETRLSMGELELRMEEPNQVAMKTMNIQGGMGEVNVYDIQNYGIKKGRVKGRMGEFGVHASGMLQEDIDLHVKVSMGSARVNIPENAILDHQGGTFMGESRYPAREPKFEGEKATVKLRGGATMGEFRVARSNQPRGSNRQVARKIQREGIAPYISQIKEIHEANPESPELRPSVLNTLGYRMLNLGNHEAAIEIFKTNIEFHPNYANGYDSLGEAYYRNDQDDLALEFYQKALEMDPENDNAQRYIDRLEERSSMGMDTGDESL